MNYATNSLSTLNNIYGNILPMQEYKLNRKTDSFKSDIFKDTDSISVQDVIQKLMNNPSFAGLINGIVSELICRRETENESMPSFSPRANMNEGKIIMFDKTSEATHFFIENLKSNKAEKIFTFIDDDIIGVWIVVSDLSINQELIYSRLLRTTKERYPQFDCDFMAFDEEEILEAPIPKNAKLIYDLEGV